MLEVKKKKKNNIYTIYIIIDLLILFKKYNKPIKKRKFIYIYIYIYIYILIKKKKKIDDYICLLLFCILSIYYIYKNVFFSTRSSNNS